MYQYFTIILAKTTGEIIMKKRIIGVIAIILAAVFVTGIICFELDPENVNYGTLNEKPCPGYYNDGQFDALVENGGVLAMFTGHDHTNAFGVRNQNIDIYTSPMTRYKGLAYTTQYGYRVVEIDENDTATYETRVERLYDVFDFDYIRIAEENGDKYSKRIAFELAVKGKVQEMFLNLWQSAVELLTGRTVTYPD